MIYKLKKYLKFLKIEIEDIEDDLIVYKRILSERAGTGETTKYVYQENSALLTQEVSGVNELLKLVSGTCPDNYKTIKEMYDDLDEMIEKTVLEHEFPEAVHCMVKKRMKKLLEYMNHDDEIC